MCLWQWIYWRKDGRTNTVIYRDNRGRAGQRNCEQGLNIHLFINMRNKQKLTRVVDYFIMSSVTQMQIHKNMKQQLSRIKCNNVKMIKLFWMDTTLKLSYFYLLNISIGDGHTSESHCEGHGLQATNKCKAAPNCKYCLK